MKFGSDLHVSIRVWSVFVSSIFAVVACVFTCVCLFVTVLDWEEKQGGRQGWGCEKGEESNGMGLIAGSGG